ncbi:tRNA methyl transferase-domain-containing protein [Pisolithus microcarpus]|nr:tRNA methyl transferase-domain-containing protein [Pisolithus microcarpus]
MLGSLKRCPAKKLPKLRIRYYNDDYSRGPLKGDKVVVAMSGGVDSSVAARLLAEKDYDLSAVFMRNWDTRDESGTDVGCQWEKDWEDVQRVCRMVDLHRQYWTQVFEPSLNSWESGSTPNPDVWCNREVKFGALLQHLAQDSQTLWIQTYYLSSIPESSLTRALFPLGEMHKKEVRNLALKWDLPTAQIAIHQGLWNYTVGQGAKIRGCRTAHTNTVFVVPGSPPVGLQQSSGMTAQVKYRHCMESAGCVVHRDGSGLRLRLDVPQKGIAPGQVATLYLQDWCLGCGVIDETDSKG